VLAFADSHHRHVGFDTLRIQKYHGSCKETDIEKLVDSEIVLTTYATIAAEFSRNSRLHSITWFRIVLDEGKPHCNPTSCRNVLTASSPQCPQPKHQVLSRGGIPFREEPVVSYRHTNPE
jgi:SNF2-related domain